MGLLAARIGGALLVRLSQHRRTSRSLRLLAPDQCIKSLEKDLRRQHDEVQRRERALAEFRDAYEQRANELDAMRTDVRDAVKLTRELRTELIERVHKRIVAEHAEAQSGDR